MDITYGRRKKRIYLFFYPDEHDLFHEVLHVLRFHIEGDSGDVRRKYIDKHAMRPRHKGEELTIILGPNEREVILGVRVIHYLIGRGLDGRNRAYHLKKAFVRHIYPNIKDSVRLMQEPLMASPVERTIN
jgi:hypothetical protein